MVQDSINRKGVERNRLGSTHVISCLRLAETFYCPSTELIHYQATFLHLVPSWMHLFHHDSSTNAMSSQIGVQSAR